METLSPQKVKEMGYSEEEKKTMRKDIDTLKEYLGSPYTEDYLTVILSQMQFIITSCRDEKQRNAWNDNIKLFFVNSGHTSKEDVKRAQAIAGAIITYFEERIIPMVPLVVSASSPTPRAQEVRFTVVQRLQHIDAESLQQLYALLNLRVTNPEEKKNITPQTFGGEEKLKLRKDWFTAVIGFCDLALADIPNAPRAKEWSRRLATLRDDVVKSSLTNMLQVTDAKNIANEILSYLEEKKVVVRAQPTAA